MRPSLPLPSRPSRLKSNHVLHLEPPTCSAPPEPPPAVQRGWLLFNDFAVSGPLPAHEVLAPYDGQKLPALVFYERVGAGRPKRATKWFEML